MKYLKYAGIATFFSFVQIGTAYMWGDLVFHTPHYYWADQWWAGLWCGFWILVFFRINDHN
jgi:hypothetical protein